jgi:TfoX/Sxy family transcriptional regulator of competence genes
MVVVISVPCGISARRTVRYLRQGYPDGRLSPPVDYGLRLPAVPLWAMAYDEDLAGRIREELADKGDITEKRMFGGLAFLHRGHMTVAASHTGGLLVRIDPKDTDAALTRPYVSLMEMGGRTMDGWIRVDAEGVRNKRQLSSWVKRSLAFVDTLPPK